MNLSASILVIDDNNDIRENIVEILELAGYQVMGAANGKTGAAMALSEQPTVIICDIMMPELDGYGVLHLLRTNPVTQQIPVIFLTAKSERSDFRKGMELGADDYITKPFDDIELLRAVEMRLRKLEIAGKNYPVAGTGITDFFKDVEATVSGRQNSGKFELNTHTKKQHLYSEHNKPRFVFYLAAGKVKTYRSHPDGKEYITGLYAPGDFIGYTSLIQDKPYDETAEVMENAEILRIGREEFLKLLYNDPALSAKFIQMISGNIKEKEDRLVNLAYSSLRRRVAKALTDISVKFKPQTEIPWLEISREELAQYVGTATESLIRTLSEFKAEGLIEIKAGKIILKDAGKLKG